MKTLIIGLNGFAGAGKDTAAKYLREALEARGHRVACAAFAEPIRAALIAMGVPTSYIYTRELKELPVPGWGKSYRELAQTLGTEWGRDLVGTDIWVRRMEHHLEGLFTRPAVAIITDVRLQNEADWITTRGGLLVRVNRPGVAPVREHTSEAGLQGIEQVLDNDGDLVRLRSRIETLHLKVLAHMALEGFGR